MDFPRTLKHCQLERHLTNEQFSKLLGKSRTWLQQIYSKSSKGQLWLLSEQTMYDIHEKVNIPIELMEEYNQSILNKRKESDMK